MNAESDGCTVRGFLRSVELKLQDLMKNVYISCKTAQEPLFKGEYILLECRMK